MFGTEAPMLSMTLRDWFASQALPIVVRHLGPGEFASFEDISRWAYAQADAMMAFRAAQGIDSNRLVFDGPVAPPQST